MKERFKDKVLSLYRRTIQKHPKLRIPMMIFSVILLTFDRIAFLIKQHIRQYVAVLLSLMFAFVSCSFSSVIWGDKTNVFDDANAVYYSETEESLASLAVETDINETNVIDEDIVEEDINYENIEDLSDMDMVTSADILDNVDITAFSDNEDEQEEFDNGFSRDAWELVLVNKNHPISDDYTFELGQISGSMQCDKRIIPDLYAMIEAALADGVSLLICSPYRNDDRQQMLFDRKVNKYMAQGMSYMESYKLASQAVTIPGSSEHQIGLALDMISDTYSSLNEGFGDTKAGKWLAENCYLYGFVIRYPAGKEEITGIEYEPWHLRYVGKNAAKVIHEDEITLEEFWEKYL